MQNKDKQQLSAHKSNPNDLQLDSKLGLHDYFVYFCMRNQTNSIFISHIVDVYKAKIDFCKNLGDLIDIVTFETT